MDLPKGPGLQRADRVDLGHRVRLEFSVAQISSGIGLLVMRGLDGALALFDLASAALRDARRGKNVVRRLDGPLRQSVFARLAGYEDVDDADRLAFDQVQRPWTIERYQPETAADQDLGMRHARAITFMLAKVTVTGPMVRAILVAIRRLRKIP